METLILTQAKRGQGTTTLAALVAAEAARRGDRVVIAPSHRTQEQGDRHLCGVLGVPFDREVPFTRAVIEHDNGGRLDLVSHRQGFWRCDYDWLIIDGSNGAITEPEKYPGARTLLVTRNCYLAVSAFAQSGASPTPTGLVIIRESGRALSGADISQATGLPIVATIDHDPAISRLVDAGLVASRSERAEAGVSAVLEGASA